MIKMNKKLAIKYKGEVYEKGDMMEECPFEGNLDTIFLGVSEEDGERYMNFFADGEGYHYTLQNAKEEGVKIEIVKVK